MRTVEQTLSLIKELSETNYNGADYTRYLEQEVRTVIGIIFELSVPGGQETLPPLNTNKDTRSGT